ncbi:hypothetical protein NGF19_26265 [Streptomyces sp. RY43-2]|uniref:Lipoprotein n=1 Tax=Streptomyces macrolidinus TaxID=2952607 RepID=A0ABT0ZL34_9ACTN|nr:hypothetical protein [Streptomyces macrolidinus]MCN9244245.1 hypothetical protein [Streptomyces macrolidinus]
MADTRRQLRSGAVLLGGMGLLAATLTACSSDSDPDKRCVDRNSYTYGKGYRVVADKNCTTTKARVNGGWYYGGKKKRGWVKDGSFVKPGKGSGGSGGSGSYGDSHSGVHRGGFGGGHGGSGG